MNTFIYTVAVISSVIIFLAFWIGIAFVIRKTFLGVKKLEQGIIGYEAKQTEKYNNLSDLEKAKHDERVAKGAKYIGTFASVGAASVLATSVGVLSSWTIPLVLCGRWTIRNWKDQSKAVKQAKIRQGELR